MTAPRFSGAFLLAFFRRLSSRSMRSSRRLDAAGIALPIGPLAGLAQVQEPGGTCYEARERRGLVAAMTDLLLQPTGDPDDYEVVVDGQVVGRIVLVAGAWSWAIDTAFRPGRHPVYGFEPTRDAAMQAFARSWHQET
jgi:hypothetical protein